ncbi:MAG: ABC transporter permease [Cytophagales bacterium]|nr:ABC transporter permease [Cytophagales bacterium]
MIKLLKYTVLDLLRSRWSFVYLGFYLILSSVLLFLNSDLSNAIITLMNVIIILTPLIGTLFGIMYYYNAQEFTALLLSQPIKRSKIFLGQYLGVTLSLSASLIIGLSIPFVFYGLFGSSIIMDFIMLVTSGTFLTFIFSGFAIWIGLSNHNKIKGFGYAILIWLFFALIFDALLLMLLVYFNDYPIESFALIASMTNPIDLSRILVLLKLEISALMGYTGAIFQRFFGTGLGIFCALLVNFIWTLLPIAGILYKVRKRDF